MAACHAISCGQCFRWTPCAPRAGQLAVTHGEGKAASSGLRRGFFDRRPVATSKPLQPLVRTPAQKPGHMSAVPRSSMKQGPPVAPTESTDTAQRPADVQLDSASSPRPQQTAFTGALRSEAFLQYTEVLCAFAVPKLTASQLLHVSIRDNEIDAAQS